MFLLKGGGHRFIGDGIDRYEEWGLLTMKACVWVLFMVLEMPTSLSFATMPVRSSSTFWDLQSNQMIYGVQANPLLAFSHIRY